MKIVLALLLSMLQLGLVAQNISGTVQNAENNEPLAGVTVYIGNSSRSTVTNAKGHFSLEGFDNSTYTLIFSAIGYKILSIPSNEINKSPLIVQLHAKENMLDPVVVQSYEKDGWNKWGNLFIQNFIGELPFSDQCTIKNKEVIKFRFSKKNNELEAIALEPLILFNDYLGYKIRYDLDIFRINFNTHYVFYAGYPVFKDLSKGKHYLKVREERRAEVYKGSMLHFMRSLYKNTLQQDGFQIRKLRRLPNLEKQRADSLLKVNTYVAIGIDGSRTIKNKLGEIYPRDSLNYFKVLKLQPDILNVLDSHFLQADDLLLYNDTIGKVYQITDYLYITYPRKLELPEYYTNKMDINGDSCVTAVISLLYNKQLKVFDGGQYFPPTNVLTEDYWAWSEKIASMLPVDYKRKKHEK